MGYGKTGPDLVVGPIDEPHPCVEVDGLQIQDLTEHLFIPGHP